MVKFATSVPKTQVAAPIIGQLVRSGTSIGANYMEAGEAESRRDFCHKVSIAKKEAKETLHWLRRLAAAEPTAGDTCRELWREVHELTLILATMQRNAGQESPRFHSRSERLAPKMSTATVEMKPQ